MSGKKIHLREELEDKTPLKNTNQTLAYSYYLSAFILTRCKRLMILETWNIVSKRALQDQDCFFTWGFRFQPELQLTLSTWRHKDRNLKVTLAQMVFTDRELVLSLPAINCSLTNYKGFLSSIRVSTSHSSGLTVCKMKWQTELH